MNCPRQISHVIRQGDNLFQLARQHRTTVPAIIMLNEGIDPYNLQIGSVVFICPEDGPTVEDMRPPCEAVCEKRMSLKEKMRLVWEQHVYWTRLLLISIAGRLNDGEVTTERILRNPYDIAALYRAYYSSATAQKIARLLTEHLQIGASLITALRDGKSEEADMLNQQWYENSDEMAESLSGINPYYDFSTLRDMLHEHLELTTREVKHRLAGNYRADVEAMDDVEREALKMADYLTDGIMKQFPQTF